MDLSKRLMELRMKNGLTQEQVADAVGVSRQSISKWELSEAAPGAEKMKKLGEFYGLSVDALLGDDPIVPEPQGEKDPPSAKTQRRIIAALLVIIAILTAALAVGYFSQKGGDTEEEVIPFSKLQEEKIVSTPEAEFELTWGD